MSWTCPACRSTIAHNAVDRLPDPREAYRCHVCRLDLRFDAALKHMVVAPFDDSPGIAPETRAKRIPNPADRSKPKRR